LSNQADLKFKQSYLGSTGNVMKAVMLGKADAGATLDVDINKEAEELGSQLRVILTTPKRPSHPLSAHPRIPKKIQNAVAKAVLKLGSETTNSDLMRSVRMPDPVLAEYARDYKDLEEIDIKKLTTE
jgi:phosphonate transport system substrate-binding protein